MSPTWSPTHRLTWVPRFGVARAWHVRISAITNDGREEWLAETWEEHVAHVAPAWRGDHTQHLWTWNGQSGYRNEPGTVQLERLPL